MENIFFNFNDLEPSLNINSPLQSTQCYSLSNIHSTYIIPYYFQTPSEYFKHISQHEEKGLRFYLSKIITETGIILNIPHKTILTSLKLLHYIYYKIDFWKYEPFYIITTSLFISSKLEETPFSLNLIIKAVYFILTKSHIQNDKHLNINDIETNIKIMEMIIIKELGYYLNPFTKHPHKYLLHIVKLIKNDVNLFKDTWGYLNDMYYTSLIVNYSNEALVCAGIYFCSRKKYIAIVDKVEWWCIFNVEFKEIEEICAEMLKLYDEYSKYNKEKVYEILKLHSTRNQNKVIDTEKNSNNNNNKPNIKKYDYHYKHNYRSYSHNKHYSKRSRSRSRSYSRDKGKYHSHSKHSHYHRYHHH
jgi:hypothetical protein